MKIEFSVYNTVDARIAQAIGVLQSVQDSPELPPYLCNAIWAAEGLLEMAQTRLRDRDGGE